MILLTLIAMIFVNRDVKIPATNLFAVTIVIMIFLTCISALNENIDISGLTPDEVKRVIWRHTVITTIGYIVRPCLILMEILIILNNNKRYHFFNGAFRK